MGDPVTSYDKAPKKPGDQRDEKSKGQYGGLDRGLGYGGGRPVEDAAFPARDLDLDDEEEERSDKR
jgi:hypothetical protein